MAPGWLDAAEAALRADPKCALVLGHQSEQHPQASIYNLLFALEWRSASGPLIGSGGGGWLRCFSKISIALPVNGLMPLSIW